MLQGMMQMNRQALPRARSLRDCAQSCSATVGGEANIPAVSSKPAVQNCLSAPAAHRVGHLALGQLLVQRRKHVPTHLFTTHPQPRKRLTVLGISRSKNFLV